MPFHFHGIPWLKIKHYHHQHFGLKTRKLSPFGNQITEVHGNGIYKNDYKRNENRNYY